MYDTQQLISLLLLWRVRCPQVLGLSMLTMDIVIVIYILVITRVQYKRKILLGQWPIKSEFDWPF